MLSHGWPSTHYEYHDVVLRLANPGAFGDDPADAFHVVVPSLPGYGFSDIPRRRGMTPRVMSTMFVALMRELGYERFGAAGCDWGAYVTALLGLDHPDALVGIHMGMLNFRAVRLRARRRRTPRSARAPRRGAREESGYSTIQGTKPQSLAYGLMDSPAGLAGWIVEKWRRWSDCDGDVQQLFTRDELLTTIAIYWFTGTINSANRLYYESRHDPVAPRRRASGCGRRRASCSSGWSTAHAEHRSAAAAAGRGDLRRAALDGRRPRPALPGHGEPRALRRGAPGVLPSAALKPRR